MRTDSDEALRTEGRRQLLGRRGHDVTNNQELELMGITMSVLASAVALAYVLSYTIYRVHLTVNKLCRRPPQYASAPCKLTIYSYLFARWHLFRHVGYLRHQQQVDL